MLEAVMLSLTPELQAALVAQIEYYRDLGIFEMYRKPVAPVSIELQAPTLNFTSASLEPAEPALPLPAPDLPAPDLPAVQSPAEEPVIAARKVTSTPAVAAATQTYANIAAQGAAGLQQIREEIGDCTRCKLSKTRNKIVFGDGDPRARLLFVGEGPGADEDAQGLPFVGRGGQLLNNMINAMGLKREQVYIANIVKCRPPSNRVPEPDEANTCIPFLEQQIAAVQPEVIVALGSTAATYLLGVKSALGLLRGKIHASRNAKLIVTYHPAFLLRDPRQKKEAWADLKLAMKELGLRPPAAGPPA